MSALPRRLLIANRGEIACRIIRTARRLGIATVAVHSDADRDARHVRLADQAVRIGPAAARQSYLDIDALLAAARASGADAVHPGYGFLSENADFAAACAAAGLVFVGPPPAAIRAMGSKSEAKRLLEDAGVPLTPGYHGERQDEATLLAEADRIGWPLLIKASAGGGGKGIRRVDRREDFAAALAACQREAAAAFGDARVLIERCILRPRHIEVQVFADTHGRAIHLGERDCSIQRRHQKVLEEAPAPGMTAERRAAMGQAAVNAALRVGYVGAGTVEFIVAPDGEFFFMEMNTRLQVEHPVTEMITGLDLVEWQLRIAAGEPLPLAQHEVRLDGHAVELRLYAEDPARGFLPSPGRILHWRQPTTVPGVRLDTGVDAGDEITPHYDAMIAKLIAHGADRDQAFARLRQALRENFLVGPRDNLGFLARLIDTRAVRAADLDTDLIDRERGALFADPEPLPREAWLAALAALLLDEAAADPSSAGHRGGAAPGASPWAARDGFRLAGTYQRRVTLASTTNGEERRVLQVRYAADGWQVTFDDAAASGSTGGTATGGDTVALRATHEADGMLALGIDGRRLIAQTFVHDGTLHVRVDGRQAAVAFIDPREPSGGDEAAEGGLRSPMPGRVVVLHVRAGDRVRRGAALLALEAMKMEHVITAPADGVVEAVHVTEGAQVAEAVTLVDFKAD